ncbi:hypothetical protein [Kiloniella sp.]|uniref:hypothetical protein n=1 Tax=Kiloniella sp. TaxID=1938587 RepID=UPI003B010678
MTRSQLDLHRFEKVLALLDSAVEGEALAALGRAKHLLAGAGIGFNELKVGISSSQDDQDFDWEETVETAQVQKLEQELESLRWSLARQELQIATLRQSVEEKSSQIQMEQAKRHAYEGELVGLRKAHAVQMEEALNRKEEADKLSKQLEVYKAVEKVTGVGPNTSIRQKVSGIVKATSGVNSKAESRKSRPKEDVELKKSSPKAAVSQTKPSLTLNSASKSEAVAIRQGALNLVGGEDRSLGKEFRWARVEEKHQMVVDAVGARGGVGNDDGETVISKVHPRENLPLDIQAEA